MPNTLKLKKKFILAHIVRGLRSCMFGWSQSREGVMAVRQQRRKEEKEECGGR